VLEKVKYLKDKMNKEIKDGKRGKELQEIRYQNTELPIPCLFFLFLCNLI